MTLSSTVNRTNTAGDGIVTAFTFPYLFFNEDDLTVILVNDSTGVETTQTITTNYTVSGAGIAAGGTVTMVVAPAVGETLVIIREEQFTQTLDLVENDPFPSDLVEQQLDTLTMLAQQLNTEVERSAKLSDGDTSGASVVLPTPVANAVVAIWDSAGTALEIGPTASAISGAEAQATAAAASASAASTSETNAGNSETAAAASAAAASASASSGEYDTVTVLTSADSPKTLTAANDTKTYFVLDMTSGSITINLPAIGTDEGTVFGFERSGASNTVTIVKSGSDTINGSASNYSLDEDTEVIRFLSDNNSPDNWIATVQSQTLAGNGLTKTGSTISAKNTVIAIACGDETTAATVLAATTTFRMPYAFTLTDVRASLTTAATGAVFTVDINESGTTILSTKLTIDASEKTSTTAATAAVISDASLADDAEITIDIDQIGSTVAGAGLKVYLIGYAT